MVAGALETADHEFVAIATEIDKYKTEVIQDLRRGDLDIEITTASLTEYLSNKFSSLAVVSKSIPKEIVEEIRLFGISTLDQLDEIIPKDLEDYYRDFMSQLTFMGFVRDILMINDIEKYFRVSWRQSWAMIEESVVEMLANKYGVDIIHYLQKHRIQTAPG